MLVLAAVKDCRAEN